MKKDCAQVKVKDNYKQETELCKLKKNYLAKVMGQHAINTTAIYIYVQIYNVQMCRWTKYRFMRRVEEKDQRD